MRLNTDTFVRKSRISRHHLIEWNFGGSERRWKIWRHRNFHSKATNHLSAGLNSDGLEEMDRRNIHRLGERRLHRQVARAERAVVVVWLPVSNLDWRSANRRFRRHAPLNRCSVD